MKPPGTAGSRNAGDSSPCSFATILRKSSRLLVWILAVFLILLLCLPVLLLPPSSAVPPGVWIPLVLLDLLLIFPGLRTVRLRGSLPGLLIVSLLAVLASQYFAATPPITDSQGKRIPGSIASLEKITINGTEQWITIRGQDRSKPILLHLGMGGPGGGGFAIRSLFEPLEKDFVVVAWDEPGTGKSFHAAPIKSLTVDRFVEDAYTLSLYLCERFGHDRIYVYGVSWSSIIGLRLVQQHPERFHAYIGNGQMVNTTENDILGYQLALEHLAENGDTRSLEVLRRNGPPPYTGTQVTGRYVAYLDVLQEYMGLPRFTTIVPIIPFLAPEYGYIDKINHTRGLIESFEAIYPQLRDLDFIIQAPRLEVPVYFFAGRNDVNAMHTLVEKYYRLLDAPHKELIWLEGGHGLDRENLPQFVEVMRNRVLVETYPAGGDQE